MSELTNYFFGHTEFGADFVYKCLTFLLIVFFCFRMMDFFQHKGYL